MLLLEAKAFVLEALFNPQSGQESFLATGNRVIQYCQLTVGLSATKPANTLNDSVLRECDQAPCGTKNNTSQSSTLVGVNPELQSDGISAVEISLPAKTKLVDMMSRSNSTIKLTRSASPGCLHCRIRCSQINTRGGL